ncbi:MAG TPA: protein translocase subunit SecF [Actinomycetota bacterium]|nr:protein translocase subunit SecF [Actinomycetota bacterium]
MTGGLGRLYRGGTNIDFIGRRKLWFALSGVAVALCLLLLGTRGLNYGIEFEGGVAINALIDDDGPLADASVPEVEQAVREALEPVGAEDAQVQIATDDEGRHVIVQSKEVADPERQQDAVNAVADAVGSPIEATDSSRIGSKWGAEITRKAVRALVIFVLVVLLFISWRFEWKMAVSAVAALVHDLLITAGVYSFVGFEVTPSTVIAILTILGYSLYDTVVVFDKVEEDASLFATSGKMTYADAANRALNEVFMRSLNTSLSSILPVAALLFVGAGFLGASTLKDLSLALLVGLIISTYSSVFFATPLLTVLKEREPKYQATRERLRRIEQRATPAVAAAGGSTAPARNAGEGASPDASPAATSTRTKTATQTRARAGSKKAKRRKRR